MKKIAIIGAGGFGREVYSLIGHINDISPTYEVLGFYDDGFPLGIDSKGNKILGRVVDIKNNTEIEALVIAIGNGPIRKEIYNKLPDYDYPTLIHPSVIIREEDKIHMEKGCIICAGVKMTCHIALGQHVLVNLNTTIGHDTKIGSFTSIMPGANIAGEVVLGSQVLVGMGANILNKRTIRDNTTIGAGAVVTKNPDAGSVVVGIPGRELGIRN